MKTGKCRCGQVQFEVEPIPLITMVCHCSGFTFSKFPPPEQFPALLAEFAKRFAS
jgi:hypothetical protein